MALSFQPIHTEKEKNSMYKVKIMNEFMHGAIWVYDDDGISVEYNLIDNDSELQELNKRTELFDDAVSCMDKGIFILHL